MAIVDALMNGRFCMSKAKSRQAAFGPTLPFQLFKSTTEMGPVAVRQLLGDLLGTADAFEIAKGTKQKATLRVICTNQMPHEIG